MVLRSSSVFPHLVTLCLSPIHLAVHIGQSPLEAFLFVLQSKLRLAKEAKEKRKGKGDSQREFWEGKQTEEEKGLASEEGRVEGGHAGGFQGHRCGSD
ncbi:hypothetical protein CK203_010752 [Vitis vinifera]|uniref:Uncharacterized protein n=1 Tax=Vitis vinifera TaxID=29760 RepID=A0A438JTF4_VITVI|nr:hypothetical protein CK203_010752 [Vitis vinifera]